jgi:sterol desaturase/sphingolipid hydroxylase (fatty acid hydroxylase superfamily)
MTIGSLTYDWMAALAFLATLVLLTWIGRFLAFKVPALQKMREMNHEVDREKLSRKRFREAVKVNNRAGLITNLVFYFTILPFSVSLEARPLWRHAVDIVVVLAVFDFFYYLTHRFLFHGRGPLVKVHALHHQARKPTYVDALYVHPLETTIGLALYLLSIPLVGALTGAPLNAYSMAVATLLFTQLNSLNHTYVNLPYFPFKAITYITQVHHAHHVNMDCGNYATLSMIYDKMFGTYEEPVSRPTA